MHRSIILFAVAIAVVAVSLTACTTITEPQKMAAVKNRASYDLECDVEKIELTFIQNNTYGAKGCKKQQVYETEGTQVYKEGMAPARKYYYDRPSLGVGVGYGRGFGRYYY